MVQKALIFIEPQIQDSDDFDDDLYKQSKSVKNEELQQALLIGQNTKKLNNVFITYTWGTGGLKF